MDSFLPFLDQLPHSQKVLLHGSQPELAGVLIKSLNDGDDNDYYHVMQFYSLLSSLLRKLSFNVMNYLAVLERSLDRFIHFPEI